MNAITDDIRIVEVAVGLRRSPGILCIPDGAVGAVLFAHGSGSSRLSPRNSSVAALLNAKGLATLLFDLLSEDEADIRRNVFDVALLGSRLVEATKWARSFPDLSSLPFGYFGASTGAAAALIAAADKSSGVAAIVSRGGRPDLAGVSTLGAVRAPTLLIVGSRDSDVLALNREALQLMRCDARLEIVQGATHLFEEAGALDKVAELAGEWFCAHFKKEILVE